LGLVFLFLNTSLPSTKCICPLYLNLAYMSKCSSNLLGYLALQWILYSLNKKTNDRMLRQIIVSCLDFCNEELFVVKHDTKNLETTLTCHSAVPANILSHYLHG